MEPCSYQFQADKIEKMTQDLQTLQRYAGSPQIAWMLGAATGCIVSTAGMNLVFRNPKTGVVRECSLEEITSLEKLDASEIDIAKLGKEVPTDDLELYMRYQKEGSIEHFTDSEKKTISRIETMGITGDECEEILRARGREVNRPPIEEPEAVLPPRNESEGKGGTVTGTVWDNITSTADNMPATEIPTTFKIDLDGNINYVNSETGTNTLWTNSNATKHMGEYVSRFGDESWSIGTRSQVMLESYSASLNKAMETIGTEAPGRYFGTYGNWELGINTETGVVYHARMIN